MSTGMRKWMEKDCPDIPSLPAEVSIDREELRQLRDELAQYKNERDALRAELDALKSREGEVVYRWLALDYSGFCYGSNPPDNLPNRCNLKAFYAPAEVAP